MEQGLNSNDTLTKNNGKSEELQHRLLEIELQQTFENFRLYMTIFMTSATIFVAADISVLGFAVDKRSSGLIALGSLAPIAIGLTLAFIGRMFGAIFFTGLKFEEFIIAKGPLFFSSLAVLTAQGCSVL